MSEHELRQRIIAEVEARLRAQGGEAYERYKRDVLDPRD